MNVKMNNYRWDLTKTWKKQSISNRKPRGSKKKRLLMTVSIKRKKFVRLWTKYVTKWCSEARRSGIFQQGRMSELKEI